MGQAGRGPTGWWGSRPSPARGPAPTSAALLRLLGSLKLLQLPSPRAPGCASLGHLSSIQVGNLRHGADRCALQASPVGCSEAESGAQAALGRAPAQEGGAYRPGLVLGQEGAEQWPSKRPGQRPLERCPLSEPEAPTFWLLLYQL